MPKQRELDQKQIENLYTEVFAPRQVEHFLKLSEKIHLDKGKTIVDIGGGCGYFAKLLNNKTGMKVRVIDNDTNSIERCKSHNMEGVDALIGDALAPPIKNDEEIACFNLVLHHLVASTEEETKKLQMKALDSWKNQVKYIFIDEYIYDSMINNFSGRLIYEITKNKILSKICLFISKIMPSLKANTFGTGVRFRSHNEWISLFEKSGYDVVSKIRGKKDITSLPQRLLLIREMRKDSFLLKYANR